MVLAFRKVSSYTFLSPVKLDPPSIAPPRLLFFVAGFLRRNPPPHRRPGRAVQALLLSAHARRPSPPIGFHCPSLRQFKILDVGNRKPDPCGAARLPPRFTCKCWPPVLSYLAAVLSQTLHSSSPEARRTPIWPTIPFSWERSAWASLQRFLVSCPIVPFFDSCWRFPFFSLFRRMGGSSWIPSVRFSFFFVFFPPPPVLFLSLL